MLLLKYAEVDTVTIYPGSRCHHLQNGAEPFLVGGSNSFEKYARQIGSFPQVGVKIKNI